MGCSLPTLLNMTALHHPVRCEYFVLRWDHGSEYQDFHSGFAYGNKSLN